MKHSQPGLNSRSIRLTSAMNPRPQLLKTSRHPLTQPDINEPKGCDMRKAGLSPVIDDKTEVLILGSLPSDVSLAKGQYYANPSNDFWKLIGQVLEPERRYPRLTNAESKH